MSSSASDCPEEPGSFGKAHNLALLNELYSNEIFYIAECQFGLGIFARRYIAPAEVILRIEGPLIDFAETKRRGPRECMAIQIGFDRYLDTRPPGVFVNHSCEPNAGIKDNQYLVALREIQKDQEVQFDYSTTMEEQSFTMQCGCNTPSCRRTIEDFSTLPTATQASYIAQRIVMSFIVERALARKDHRNASPAQRSEHDCAAARS